MEKVKNLFSIAFTLSDTFLLTEVPPAEKSLRDRKSYFCTIFEGVSAQTTTG
ncbi:hypothetical protein [Coleofasciculus sp. G3-WIS-01]|uniref:hypothetical protein n=1 Tax=Coleofasciculus sp. G3-WIS-01 TaxID=3069528 RepID=UPI004064675D